MSDEPHPDGVDQVLSFLVACDEALATRSPIPTNIPADISPQQRETLERSLSSLKLLRRVLPRRPVEAEPEALPIDLLTYARPMLANLGRFRLRRELGRGGFGIVFLADDPLLNRQVALKIPRPEVLVHPELRQRFIREAQVAAGLDHPNVVPVHEAGEVGPLCYIASAYCAGTNLAAWLREHHSVAPRAAAGLVAAIAGAVQHAHERGILHRDLKPSNILLVPESHTPGVDGIGVVPKLTDFGLAKVSDAEDLQTSSGMLLGTAPYLAPEQAEGRLDKIGPGSDVYALGVILYELLSGKQPFGGTSLLVTLEQIRAAEPASLRRLNPQVPIDLETVCLKCLRKEPEQRYASAAELADDLGRFLRDEPIRARRPGWFDRVRRWSRRPERIRDAGFLALLYGVAHLVGLLILDGFVIARVLPGEVIGLMHLGHTLVAVPYLLIGGATLARRGLAIYLGTILVPLHIVDVFALGLNLVDSGGVFTFTDPAAQWALITVCAAIYLVIFLAYVLAVIAYRANRDIPGFLPQHELAR
jgi:hypothetical protein